MYKMKKGVSELISWVLLISFVIALGAFVAFFSISYVTQIKPGHAQELKIYCQDTQIILTDVCRDDNNVTILFTIINKGSYAISRLTVNREHSNSTVGSCSILSPGVSASCTFLPPSGSSNFPPGQEINCTLALYPELSEFDDIGIIECPLPGAIQQPLHPDWKILELSVIPWVEIEGERIACPDKKTQVSTNLLNVYCSKL